MTEHQKLRAKLERDLMTIDQKIERQDQAINDAATVRADLFTARRMIMQAMAPVQEAAE